MNEFGTIERRMRNKTIGMIVDLPTKRAARHAAQAMLQTINASVSRPGIVTHFGSFAESWRAKALPNYKATTRRVALGHLERYLLPTFKQQPLEQLTAEVVQGLVMRLAQAKLRRHTILNVLGTLGSMLSTAKKWGYLVPPLDRSGLIIPRDTRPTHRPHFTPAQVHQILAAAAEPWRTLYAVCAATGMRGAEALALSVQDLDFEGRRLFVRKTTQYGQMQLPKSARSVRTLPMPPVLADLLLLHVKSEYFRRNADGLLFTSREGAALWLDHVRERRLHPLLASLGLDKCGFHAFRRTNITTFASSGIAVRVAQEQAGHADPRVTLGIYQQIVADDHRAGAEKVADVLLGITNLAGMPPAATGA